MSSKNRSKKFLHTDRKKFRLLIEEVDIYGAPQLCYYQEGMFKLCNKKLIFNDKTGAIFYTVNKNTKDGNLVLAKTRISNEIMHRRNDILLFEADRKKLSKDFSLSREDFIKRDTEFSLLIRNHELEIRKLDEEEKNPVYKFSKGPEMVEYTLLVGVVSELSEFPKYRFHLLPYKVNCIKGRITKLADTFISIDGTDHILSDEQKSMPIGEIANFIRNDSVEGLDDPVKGHETKTPVLKEDVDVKKPLSPKWKLPYTPDIVRTSKFSVGDQVFAFWKGNMSRRAFEGTVKDVLRVSDLLLYTVKFDDGDTDTKVIESHIFKNHEEVNKYRKLMDS